MPVPAAIHPSYLTWLGLAHESAYGTPAITSATLLPAGMQVLPLDASSFSPEDKPMWLRDIAIRGSQADVYAIIQGVEDSAWSLGGPVYPGITPILLDNLFGDITTTPATGGSAAGSVTLSGVYTRNSSGLALNVSAITGFSAGTIGQIVGGGFTEYFYTVNATGTTITMQNPLHYNYPIGSTVKVYTPAAGAYYAHKFAVLNAYDGQPPTTTALDSTNVTDANADTYGQRVYTSMCLAQVDFTISAETLFTQKASGTAWISEPTTALSTPATAAYAIPSNVTALPIPAWSSNIQLSLPVGGGLTAVNYVGEVTFSLKRKIQVYWTDDGSQNPYIIARGPLGVTGTVKAVVAQDEQVLQSMLKNFQGSLQATVMFPAGAGPAFPSNALSGNTALGVTGAAFQFSVNQAAFTAAKPTRSSVLVGYDSTFEGVANTTNVGQTAGLGPITVTAVDLNAGY